MDLENLTVKKLREYAYENGIIIPKKALKREIISVIEQKLDNDNSILDLRLDDMIESRENQCLWRIDLGEENVIGSGIEGSVYKITKNSEIMAVKEEKDVFASDSEDPKRPFIKIRILNFINDIIRSGKCTSFPLTYEVMKCSGSELFIFQEFISDKTLKSARNKLDNKSKKSILFQIFYAAMVLFHERIFHCDLHEQNIMIQDNKINCIKYVWGDTSINIYAKNSAKIIDFGFSGILRGNNHLTTCSRAENTDIDNGLKMWTYFDDFFSRMSFLFEYLNFNTLFSEVSELKNTVMIMRQFFVDENDLVELAHLFRYYSKICFLELTTAEFFKDIVIKNEKKKCEKMIMP